MNCNIELHNELKESGEIHCPFCDEKLQNCSVKHDLCCDIQDIINVNGILICRSCGVVNSYDLVNKYINFYEEMHKMRRKSVYH